MTARIEAKVDRSWNKRWAKNGLLLTRVLFPFHQFFIFYLYQLSSNMTVRCFDFTVFGTLLHICSETLSTWGCTTILLTTPLKVIIIKIEITIYIVFSFSWFSLKVSLTCRIFICALYLYYSHKSQLQCFIVFSFAHPRSHGREGPRTSIPKEVSDPHEVGWNTLRWHILSTLLSVLLSALLSLIFTSLYSSFYPSYFLYIFLSFFVLTYLLLSLLPPIFYLSSLLSYCLLIFESSSPHNYMRYAYLLC